MNADARKALVGELRDAQMGKQTMIVKGGVLDDYHKNEIFYHIPARLLNNAIRTIEADGEDADRLNTLEFLLLHMKWNDVLPMLKPEDEKYITEGSLRRQLDAARSHDQREHAKEGGTHG